jgi:hypothetical protein
MFRKISNYLAVLSLSVLVGGSALAGPVGPTEKNEEVRVDETRNFNFYNEVIVSGGKHSYTVRVEAGKGVKVRFKGDKAATLKIKTPNGEVKSYSQDKFFELRLRGEGEYVIELESLFINQYSLEVFQR